MHGCIHIYIIHLPPHELLPHPCSSWGWMLHVWIHVPWCTAAPLCKKGERMSISAWMTKRGDAQLPLTALSLSLSLSLSLFLNLQSFCSVFTPADFMWHWGSWHWLQPGWNMNGCLYKNMTVCALLMGSLPSAHKNRESLNCEWL